MTTVDPAAQWLFWLLPVSLMYVASWVPQWRHDWRVWYDAWYGRARPFMWPPLFFGGLQTTLLWAASYAGVFLLWRQDPSGFAHADAPWLRATALGLYIGATLVYSVNQVPFFYWRLPLATLAITGAAAALYSAAASMTCAVRGDGVSLYPAACVLQLAWCAWLWFVLGANLLIYALVWPHGAPSGHALEDEAVLPLALFVTNGGANPPARGAASI
jgi:hypothetical protein